MRARRAWPTGHATAMTSDFEQTFEKVPVALERLPQLVRGDLPALGPLRFHAECCWRKPPTSSSITIGHEGIGLVDGSAGVVDKADLDRFPLAAEAFGV